MIMDTETFLESIFPSRLPLMQNIYTPYLLFETSSVLIAFLICRYFFCIFKTGDRKELNDTDTPDFIAFVVWSPALPS